MKNNWIFLTTFILSLASFYYLGCNKTDHPFGVYAPNGLDVPTVTATPVTGAILAGVVDNNVAKSGVTVLAVDPLGVTIVSVTDGFGLAAFNPTVLELGTWTIQVPTQGRYYQSSIPLTVTGNSNNNVTFQAGSQSISATPVGSSTYGSSNTSIAYNLVYDQPYNLKVPVVLSANSGLPVAWTKTFQPVTIGSAANNSNVTIGKTGCYTQNFPFSFNATDLLGTVVSALPMTISRGFLIPISVGITGSGGTIACGGPCAQTYLNFAVSLSTTNDCNYSYPVNISATYLAAGSAVTALNKSTSLITGSASSSSITVNGNHLNDIAINVIVTTPVSQLYGNIISSSAFNSTLITTSY